MGFFRFLSKYLRASPRETPQVDRVEVVRNIACESRKYHIEKYDALTPYSSVDIEFIRALPAFGVMALPDATAFTIFENFVQLIQKGATGEQAILIIEQNRNSAVKGKPAYPRNFVEYINYRVALEHGDSPEVWDAISHITLKLLSNHFQKGIHPSQYQ